MNQHSDYLFDNCKIFCYNYNILLYNVLLTINETIKWLNMEL